VGPELGDRPTADGHDETLSRLGSAQNVGDAVAQFALGDGLHGASVAVLLRTFRDTRGKTAAQRQVILATLTGMRVTQKGQVTIPLEVRRALGIEPGSDVDFEVDGHGARLVVDRERAADEIDRMRGAGEGVMTTDEILALTRG